LSQLLNQQSSQLKLNHPSLLIYRQILSDTSLFIALLQAVSTSEMAAGSGADDVRLDSEIRRLGYTIVNQNNHLVSIIQFSWQISYCNNSRTDWLFDDGREGQRRNSGDLLEANWADFGGNAKGKQPQ
jgi:hypothetical protein